MQDSNWQVVFETNDEIEATLAKDYLGSNGIQVVLKGDESLVYIGALPSVVNYQLWIHTQSMQTAIQLLKNLEKHSS